MTNTGQIPVKCWTNTGQVPRGVGVAEGGGEGAAEVGVPVEGVVVVGGGEGGGADLHLGQ